MELAAHVGVQRKSAQHAEDGRGRIWGRLHTNQPLEEAFRFDGDLCPGTDNVFKSIHLLYQDAGDEKGSYSELICYDCSASEAGNPTLEGFLANIKRYG